MAQCTGTSKRSGVRCQRSASTGYSVCASHGAGGGAPQGNKNALKTGEYETIWLDQLTTEEQAFYPRINPDALAQLEEELRLTTIRERRMLARIAALEQHEYTVVEKRTEHKQGVDAGDSDEDATGSVDVTTTHTIERGTLGQVQEIEHALTRVQQAKTRLIELRHRLHSGGEDDDALADLVAVIARSRQEADRRRQAASDDSE